MTQTQLDTQLDAQSLFRAAYENRYTWDADFPGFTADVTLNQGGETYTGKVRVNADLSYEVVELSDEAVRESLQGMLWEIVTHRKRNSFEQAHGKNRFSLGNTDDTGAVEILVSGDAMGSNYKLRNNEICQVSRVMGGNAFVINHHTSLDTGAGYISTGYDVTFRNAETREVVRENRVDSTYENFGGYYLLTRQVIHSTQGDTQTTTEFTLSNIALL
ncbi:DUF3386 domain-containing protein [Thermoleptolyngbya sp.]